MGLVTTPSFLSCPVRFLSLSFPFFLRLVRCLLHLLSAGIGMVCVCVTPCLKGLLASNSGTQAGPAADKQTLANKAMLVQWMHSLINCVYLRPTFAQAVTPLSSVWFMVLTCYLPPNPGFLQLHRAARFVTAEFCRHEKQLLFKHLQFLELFTMPFPRLPSQRGN